MQCYPDKEMSTLGLVKQITRLLYTSFKKSLVWIVLIALVQHASISWLATFGGFYGQAVIDMLALILIAFFFSVALYSSHHAFIDQPVSMMGSIKAIWQKKIHIFSVLLMYVVGAILVYYAVELIIQGVDRLLHEPSALHGLTLILTTAFLLMYVAMFYFAFPLAVIDEKPFPSVFYDSLLLTEKNKTGVIVLLMILGALIIMMTPGMAYMDYLMAYHLQFLYTLVLLCIAVPIYINLLLLLIHDSKKQMSE
jgi:hypothetical protein